MSKLIAFMQNQPLIDWKTPATEDGCLVKRVNLPDERYVVDYADDFMAEGWQQFDTSEDAHYFGVWINPTKRMTLSYTEGDWTLVECHDWPRYAREITRMCDFYGEGRIAMVIDADSGQSTVFKQDRQAFLVE